MRRYVEIGADPLVSVSSRKGDLLAFPVGILLVDTFDARIEVRRIIGIDAPVKPERFIRRRLLFVVITDVRCYRRLKTGLRSRVVAHAAESILGGAIPREARVQREEHVRRLIPCAATNVPLATALVPAPLSHIAGHIQRAKSAKAFVRADARGPGAAEIAQLSYIC